MDKFKRLLEPEILEQQRRETVLLRLAQALHLSRRPGMLVRL